MEETNQRKQINKTISEVKTFPVPFTLEEGKKNISISTNSNSQVSQEQIINQALRFHSKGNISEAARYYQLFIKQGFKDHRVFTNYGAILKGLRKEQEAESWTRKAIELNPNSADAHYNLAQLLSDLGKLEEALYNYQKAIELRKDYKNAIGEMGRVMTLKGNYKDGLKKLKEGFGSIIFDHVSHELKINF
tara:strand:+ start:168 stop:740 length:573 start_codon:yes stop_codon:yes gene_type:complete